MLKQSIRNPAALLLVLFCLFGPTAHAQFNEGTVEVTVTDPKNEPIPFAAVEMLLSGVRKHAGQTDIDGRVRFSPVTPGTYSVKVNAGGYATKQLEGIEVTPNRETPVRVRMGAEGIETTTGEVIITYTKDPIVKLDNTTSQVNLNAEQIRRAPYRGVNQIAATTAGTFSQDGSTPSIRGDRAGGTIYFIDGVRVTGSLNMPQSSIDQMSIISGGIPAEYGDATGGIISITTRGPSSKFFGGVEAITSEFLDPYGYNLIEGNLGGPLLKIRRGADSGRSVLGFFVAGNLGYNRSTDPGFSTFRIREDALRGIQDNPLRPSPLGSGFVSAGEFVTLNEMERTYIRPNTAARNYSGNLKLDFQPVRNINITAGGQIAQNSRNAFINSYNMFNFDNNPQVIDNTRRGYLRFRQTFQPQADSGQRSVLMNAYYTLQADYTSTNQTVQDPNHKDDVFAYGYLGKFERFRAPSYLWQTHRVYDPSKGDTVEQSGFYLQGYFDTLVTFTPGGYNPVTENYTKRFFELSDNNVVNYNQIQAQGGLLNGQQPLNVYSLWAAPGSTYGFYSRSQTEMFSLLANASATIKPGKDRNAVIHDIKAGIQYEQRLTRGYNVGRGNNGATGLWTLARQLTNNHLTQLDTDNPIPVRDEFGNFTDTINYPYQFTGNQSQFDENFRNYLIGQGARDEYGRLIDYSSFINIDRYSPEELKLSYFSADELLNNGNSYVRYYGYDYLGNKQRRKPSIEDFLDSSKRFVAPYNPIYIAGFIQDQFKYKDIIFRLGLRVDRFDANQPVLRDPFVLYPTRTVGEIVDQSGDININGTNYNRPGNIGDDYVVYVDDAFNPTRPVGYRNGATWYNATGAEIADPNILAEESGGTIAPYLQARNIGEATLSRESFRDYRPQVTLMPRIAFSFPISEEAAFFANYDVLTQRPGSGNFATIEDYFYLRQRATGIIANPDLKPERRTNYEIGFKQMLSKQSGLTLQAFYGEIKDLIQLVRINQAYPQSYTTFGNVDFGTVKGFIMTYELRRQNSSGVQLMSNYTLQFANGTGSNTGTAQNLISVGQPNLRTPFPLDYDVRHQLVTSLDYRFGVGNEYQGPGKGGKQWLEDAGINLVLNARSGTPYTRQSNVTQAVAIGIAQRSAMTGTINGSRLPWQFRADMRLDKSFRFASKKSQSQNGAAAPGSATYLNAYLWVQNVLNTRNIVSVYRYTGEADDDGFISSAEGRQTIEATSFPQAFIDQYSVRANNPDNYLQPRLIRIGASINF